MKKSLIVLGHSTRPAEEPRTYTVRRRRDDSEILVIVAIVVGLLVADGALAVVWVMTLQSPPAGATLAQRR